MAGLSMRLLGTLRYTLGITFWYPENYVIRQPFGPGGAGYRNFYCILKKWKEQDGFRTTWKIVDGIPFYFSMAGIV
jgi:hypothetical protein